MAYHPQRIDLQIRHRLARNLQRFGVPDVEIDIPQRDIDNSFRAANGGIIGDMELD